MVRPKLIALLASTLLLSALLLGCSSSIDGKNFIGQWEFLHGSEESLGVDEVTLAKSLGDNIIMSLNENGTGTLDVFGDITDLTWKATSDTSGTLTLEGSNAATMEIQDEELILSNSNDSTLVFGRYQNE